MVAADRDRGGREAVGGEHSSGRRAAVGDDDRQVERGPAAAEARLESAGDAGGPESAGESWPVEEKIGVRRVDRSSRALHAGSFTSASSSQVSRRGQSEQSTNTFCG